ncbi:MAG: sigma-70 family RNA polymerase sigma factor [Elusimicrobiales bacterium]|nr:sigma-70 family RNA polymerase sigma factor [Elusimicrobiales bacterium]
MDFASLYDRWFSRIYNYVRCHVWPSSEADDVTGKIFEAALRGYGTYDAAKGPEQGWLFGIARNAVIDWARARSRRGEVSLDDSPEPVSGDPGLQAALERKEEKAQLLAAIAGLDERARDIIALKFNSGMNNREIAAMTGLGESNVGIILYRAVKKMQQDIEGKRKL